MLHLKRDVNAQTSTVIGYNELQNDQQSRVNDRNIQGRVEKISFNLVRANLVYSTSLNERFQTLDFVIRVSNAFWLFFSVWEAHLGCCTLVTIITGDNAYQ